MTQPSDGFQQAAGDLQGIRQGNDQMQQQISGGQLRMQPDAANRAAAAYKKAAKQVAHLADRAGRLQQLPGLGDYPSARQLSQKFSAKASNGSTGAADLLGQLRDELTRKAKLFEQAAQAYAAQEEQISGDLKKGVQ